LNENIPIGTQPRELISAQAIAQRVASLGQDIAASVPDGPLHVVSVLRGAFVFTADLVRALRRDVRCDFMSVRSYGSETVTSGVVQITQDLGFPVVGKHLLLVEDIVDSGLTLRYLIDLLRTRHPASLHTCALLNKPSRRRTEVTVDFVGFEIPDLFVVGYGLDYDQRYRNLPYVGVIEPEPEEAP
jgi:hypoxanthine phosphoribosyltransferase